MEQIMSNWNQLENELRSWTPRAPSPDLKARLFGARSTLAEAGAATSGVALRPFTWNWLAPSMALVCLGMLLTSQQHGMLHGTHGSDALYQPDLSTYYVSVRHSENNTPMAGLEWTNHGVALSTGPTNLLIH
jgi:hypothetical protein